MTAIGQLVNFGGEPIAAVPQRRLRYPGGTELLDMVGEVKGPTTLSPTDFLTVVRVEVAEDAAYVEFAHGVRCTSCGDLIDLSTAGQPGGPLLEGGDDPYRRRAWCADCATNWKAAP